MADLATIRIPVDSSDMVRAVKDARGLENSIKLLEKSFGTGNIGSQQFSKGLLQLKRQYEGLFGSSQKATSEVQRYARSLQEVRTSQAGLVEHVNQASKGMNKFGVAAQQTGYQVSDFIVQVQGGTNPLVAFSQQATQLAGLLYLLPPATQAARIGMLGFSVSMATATAGLTIIIPLFAMLAMSFFNSGKGAKDGADGINTFSGAITALTAEIQKNQEALLKAKFGTDILGLASAIQQIEDFEAKIASLQASIDKMKSQGGKAAAFSGLMLGSLEELEAQKKALEDQVKALRESQRALDGIAAAEEASRVQNLYKLQLLDEQQVRLENGKKLVRELLSTYTDVGGAVKAISEIDLKAVFEDAVEPSSALYQFVANTFDTMVKMTDAAAAAQRTDYYKLGTLNEGAMGRAGAAGQGLAESYSFVEKAAKKLTGTTKTLKKELTDAEKAAKEFADSMQGYVVGAVQSVSDAFGDFVMRGFKDFKGFVNSILSSFTSMLAQMIALAARNKIMVSMGLGGAGSIAGGVANAATGGMGGLGGIATGIGGIGGTIGGGLMAGAGLALNGGMAGIVGGVTGGLSAFTSGIGAIGSVAGAGGMALGGLATAIGAIALPIAAVVAVFSFFKKKTKELDSGLNITVNNMDTLVETFKTIETKRFWGLSKKVSTSIEAASSEIADPIETAISAIQNSIVDMAGALSVGSEAFDNFYFQLKLSLKGLSAEEATAKIQEELMKVGDAMAEMIPDLIALSQGSETASETLVRLYTSLQVANAYFGPLIDTLFQASLAGADLASTMIQAFGSVDAFNSNMAFFAQNFYTQAEQITWASDRINTAFTDLGMTAPATAEAFRKLVEDLMKATTSGVEGAAEQLAAVLAVQQDMLAVSVYEAEQAAEAQRLAIQLGEEATRLAIQLGEEATRIAKEKATLDIKLLEAQDKAVEALKLQREAELAALNESNRAIQQQIYALQDLAEAQERVNSATSNLRDAMDRELAGAQSAMDAARGQLEKAVERRVEAIQKGFAKIFERIEAQIDSAKAKAESSRRIFELLDNALSGRSAVSEAGAFASRRTAMTYVSSGGMDVDKLTSALGILNEPSEQFFGTFQDYARDFALTTNAIEKSRAVAEATMTADERAVQLLEQSLERARASEARQIAAAEKLLAINEEVLTVQEALTQYLAAQATYEQVQAQHKELVAQFPMLNQSVLSVADAVLSLRSAIAAQTAAQTAATTAAAAFNNLASSNPSFNAPAIEKETNQNASFLKKLRKKMAEQGTVPGFAAGGMFGGGPRIVGENGPELEVTGPSRIYSKQDTSNMFRDPDLASAVQGLRNEVSGMRSEQLQLQVEISKNTKRVYDVERKWDIDGLPPVRV